jgi:hypothetical protein
LRRRSKRRRLRRPKRRRRRRLKRRRLLPLPASVSCNHHSFRPNLTCAASVTAPVVAAPVLGEEAPKPIEEPTQAVLVPTEEKKVEEKPKPTKRGSIFGNFVEKLKSPTHEKKEADLVPAPKEEKVSAEAPKLDELPKSDDAPVVAPVEPVVPVADATAEAPKTEEVKPVETKAPTTPAKEKQHFSFGKFLGGNKEKVKSPATEKTPEVAKSEEAPKLDETATVAPITPIEPVAPVEPVAETPAEIKEEKEEAATEAPTNTPATQKRGSIFGALGGSVKKEKDGEEKPKGLKGLFRNASKAGKSKKEKEPVATPAKVDETAEPTEATTDAAAETKEADAAALPAEQTAIGDVVPDAVTVGQAPKSTPQVASTA